MRTRELLCLAALLLTACNNSVEVTENRILVDNVTVNGTVLNNGATIYGVSPETVEIEITFTSDIDVSKFDESGIQLLGKNSGEELSAAAGFEPCVLVLTLPASLEYYSTYRLSIPKGEMLGGNVMVEFSAKFTTSLDESLKFPEISDEDLLTLVQEQTFKYFWDYAHPVSGLARERYESGNTVTSGGSGFGIMSIPVGVERGFITREEGAARLLTTVTFLKEKAETFHGAYPHWLNGETGEAIAFSTKDDGADLVETAFLIQGLLTAAEYFTGDDATETSIRELVSEIWRGVEWDWFTKTTDGDALYWHWSPNYNWDMNMQINGWNEALIVYVLAASSPTHPIDKSVYTSGWAQNGGIVNGKKFYDITLPLGSDYGGSLFFAHYSFLGLDPRKLEDQYANYWEQNVAHAQINRAYCIANPKNYYGYSSSCWGLTASDYPDGYTASSPTNDNGTIAPTAALASFPYTPEESMEALHYFYYVLGDKIWGDYGFNDAFNLQRSWFASSYIAIDQGPIIVMIENYRTGLLWDCFMKNEDVRSGLDLLGFTY